MQINNGGVYVESTCLKYKTVKVNRMERQKKVKGLGNVHHWKDTFSAKELKNRFDNGKWLLN